MDSFSSSDSLRALCAPLCCCFSRRLALSPSNESLNQLARDEGADAARARSGELGPELAAHGDDLAAYEARLGGPAWGQQAGVVHLGATTPRSRQRRRGGDISGGGTDTGSGLTRWTLFRSWLRGGQGAVQLPDSEDDEAENNGNSRSSSSTRLLGRTYGDEDAAPIALDDVSLPPAPPFAATLSSQYSSGPPSSSDQTTSDGRSALDAEAASEREARRQRRRIRRQARELGLSPEEYTERVNKGLLSVTAATEATRDTQEDDVAQTRSHASNESSGSRRSRRAAAPATDPPVSSDGAYPATTTSSSSSSRRRRRHDGHRSQLSESSHSNTVSSSSSSKRSDRRRRHARDGEDETTAPARSPLESRDDRFFEDEHGQLHAFEQGDETTVSYDHIGVLPGAQTSVADDA
ncbi:hypothetical protein C6P46_006933 [Rhodotorula mucilaginosa]|uniref:Uncharacterized protein n=1 Tax=Rhodotorula mucilaginosa TaxID=5537 RepID=A0A9P7B3U8_RHOMI|nr:hypothetical protein C6P46_006933 [Rhodotorula mucilaginosa]